MGAHIARSPFLLDMKRHKDDTREFPRGHRYKDADQAKRKGSDRLGRTRMAAQDLSDRIKSGEFKDGKE